MGKDLSFSMLTKGLCLLQLLALIAAITGTYSAIGTKDGPLYIYAALILGMLIAIAIPILLVMRISQPLDKLNLVVDAVSNGDFSARYDGPEGDDEIGRLSRSINQMSRGMAESLQGAIDQANQLQQTSQSLAVAASDALEGAHQTVETSEFVSENSRSMTKYASGIVDQVGEIDLQATNIAQSIAKISDGLNSVDVAVEQMTTSANELSQSVSEVSGTLHQIAHKTERTTNLTSSATAQARKTSELINTLGVSAERVGDVVVLIKGVAEQTNMLALNATIEAASAGEAGKGFAVVANEVKELAKQTSEATDDIRQKIETIQNSTNITVEDMGKIRKTINNEVSNIVVDIANAVEQSEKLEDEEERPEIGLKNRIDHILHLSRQLAEMGTQLEKHMSFFNLPESE